MNEREREQSRARVTDSLFRNCTPAAQARITLSLSLASLVRSPFNCNPGAKHEAIDAITNIASTSSPSPSSPSRVSQEDPLPPLTARLRVCD